MTALLSFSADLVRAAESFVGRRAVALVGLGGGGFQLLQLIRAGIDQRDVGDEFGGQRRQPVDRRRIFARGGAQRKQPLLDALQFGRIEIGRDQGCAEMLVGLFQRVDRDIDRLHRRLDQRGRIGGAAFQAAYGGGQRRHRRMGAADRLLRLAQVACDLLALHHDGAASGERRLLAVLRLQRLQFVGGVAQIVRLAGGAFHAGAMRVERACWRCAAPPTAFPAPRPLSPARRRRRATAGASRHRPARARHAGRGSRPATAPTAFRVCTLIDWSLMKARVRPSASCTRRRDHLAGIVEAVLGKDLCGRMAARDIEGGRHLALLRAMAHQTRIAAAAERQRERIEQDGFARAGLAGQHREATGEFDIEPFDQDDVTDRQTRQHAVNS